ncbi:MAG: helix-turn-helix domain-containing protein [Paramuribaculum sp.]|nr:helix-turn-helix domain-containing protein [Paramuribaculum sp.]
MMAKYDFHRLRKEVGITQKQLAEKLNITQGFMSSVENGRNLFPEDRIDDLQSLFPQINLEDFEIKEQDTVEKNQIGANNTSSDIQINDPETLKMLLSFVHNREIVEKGSREMDVEEIKTLRHRNDKLNDKLESLKDNLEKAREEIFKLRQENLILKSLLEQNHIEYPINADRQ